MSNPQTFNSKVSETFKQFRRNFLLLKQLAHMVSSMHNPRSNFQFHHSCKPNPTRLTPSTAQFQAARPNSTVWD